VTTALSHIPDTNSVVQNLSHQLNKGKFKLWFQSAKLRVENNTLHITVANPFVAKWIDGHYHDQLLTMAKSEIGDDAEVKLNVAPASTTTNRSNRTSHSKKSNSHNRHAATARRSSATGPSGTSIRHDLANFIVGPANELAYTAAERLADDPNAPLNPLFIHGGCGLGKTHLLQGLCRRFASKHSSDRLHYTTAEQFTNQFIYAIRHNQLSQFRRRLRRLDLLAVDDVHFFSNKSATQIEFLHTFDTIGQYGAKLVLASDAHPKQIRKLSEALTSRFMGGMIARIDPPDAELRADIIKSLAKRRGLNLLQSVIDELADQPAASVRELEGRLSKLEALASMQRNHHDRSEPIGHALLDMLNTTPPMSNSRRPVRFEQIMKIVCEQLGVERDRLTSRCRHRRIVLARSLLIYLARKLTTLSYPELARALGKSNHSTIVTADQRVKKQIAAHKLLPLDDSLPGDTIDQLAQHLRRCIAEST